MDYSELLQQKIFLLKPNEHEARILTGIKVTDFNSAKKAANTAIKAATLQFHRVGIQPVCMSEL